jgi:excisionase family DNA binding protein
MGDAAKQGQEHCGNALDSSAMEDRWLAVDEMAEYLGVSKDTVYSWVTAKGMPGYRVGRFWKFKKDDVDDWVRAEGAASSTDEELEETSNDG